jgi:hypothetical protein
MLHRRGKGHKPQLIFTSDFHELVRGDLITGPVVLRYDPYRIVPPQEMAELPATQRPVTAYCRFHPHAHTWQGDMRFPRAHRLQVDYDSTGQGTVFEIEFPLPNGCSEIECWFSYVDNRGATRWDSEMGANYWMRFPSHDLDIRTADLVDLPDDPQNRFKLQVDSVSEVDSMLIRWRYTAFPADPRHQQGLISRATDAVRKSWTPAGGALGIASKTPIAFDLVYTVGAHQFTDDNEGTWYVVSK